MKEHETNRETLNDQHFDAPFVERMTEMIILCLIMVVALIGNISLWIVILRNDKLRMIYKLLLLCLSGADLLVSTINMPVTLFNLMIGHGLIGNTACIVIGFINMLTFVASVMSLACISWNRYKCICTPMQVSSAYTVRRTTWIVAGN
jgi:hypothetical protein